MNKLSAIRKNLHMTQDEFAEYCNVSRITIARYETGADISVSSAKKIAAACGVSLSYLLENTETDTPLQGRIIGEIPKEEPKPEPPDDTLTLSWLIRERLRRDPNYRLLFDAADKATPEHLRAAAEMLKALEKNNDEY